MRWSDVVRIAAIKAAGIGAGLGAGAMLAAVNPALGLVVANPTKKFTEDVVTEVLQAQSDQLREVALAVQQIEGSVGRIEDAMSRLQDRDWKSALLHLEEARRHPDQERRHLEYARVKLFDAVGSARNHIVRGFVEQQLAVVYHLLNSPEDTLLWLGRSCQDNLIGAQEYTSAAGDFILRTSGQKLRFLSARDRSSIPADKLCISATRGDPGRYSDLKGLQVDRSSIEPVLVRVADAIVDMIDLSVMWSHLSRSPVWKLPSPSSLMWPGPQYMSKIQPGQEFCTIHTPSGWTVDVFYPPGIDTLTAKYEHIRLATFEISGCPMQPDERVSLLGDSIELGAWDVTRAAELQRSPYSEFWRVSNVVFLGGPSPQPIEYKYFIKEPSGEIRWEEGPNYHTVLREDYTLESRGFREGQPRGRT